MPISNAAEARAQTLQNRGGTTPDVSVFVAAVLARVTAQLAPVPQNIPAYQRRIRERLRRQPYLINPFAVPENAPEPHPDVMYYTILALEGLGFRVQIDPSGQQVLEWG